MSYINRKAVKDIALRCGQNRAHKYTRVSKKFLDEIDALIPVLVARRVRELPSKGKTI